MSSKSGKKSKGMEQFKYEVASEYGLPVSENNQENWSNLTSRECGQVGGEMVKRMVEQYEQRMKNNK